MYINVYYNIEIRRFGSMKKRIYSLFTSFIMAISLVMVTPAAATDTLTSGDYEYIVLEDGTVEITKYIGSESYLKIPSTIKGKDVTSIREYAFEQNNCSYVLIPEGITNIGDYAFYDCEKLNSIIIPKSIKNIGEQAIGFKFNPETGDIGRNTDLIVYGYEDSYAEYYSSYYGLNYKLIMIDLEDYDLNACEDYEYIVLDDGTAEVVKYNGKELNVEIPSTLDGLTVTSLGYKKLISYSTKFPGGFLPTEYEGAFQYNEIQSIIIPDTVTKIGEYVFAGCHELLSVKLPSNLKAISSYSFYECKNLKSLILPDKLETLDKFAISNCYNMPSLTIPKSVKTIAENAVGYITGNWWPRVSKDDNFKIYCYSNTSGHQYAMDNGLKYEFLDPQLEGTVYYQKKTDNTAVRFLAEVNIEDVTNTKSGNIKVTLNGEEVNVKVKNAYSSIVANGKKVEPKTGKCFIITPAIEINDDGGDTVSVEFTLDSCLGSLSRKI